MKNYKCGNDFKKFTGYLHALAIAVIATFSAIQIYKLHAGEYSQFWVPLGIAIAMGLRLPNVVCVSLTDSHGWFMVIGTMIALATNSYITNLSIEMGDPKRYPLPPVPSVEYYKI